MGRYYYGNIVGKFWFGVQSSDDPENLCCINNGYQIIYKVCHCECINQNIQENQHENEFCRDCFDSKKQHWNSVVEEDPDDASNLCYEIDEAITKWVAYASDVPKIHNILTEIDEKIHIYKYIRGIDYSEDDGYEMEIKFSEENTNKDVDELLARYVLGSQIVHYFRKTNNETCEFYGEN